ncbi:MAG TPA: glycerol kinase GlpK [Stellaceae bacterium]|nr:glycerol kinase GlpK [Stellaceae bacterium]
MGAPAYVLAIDQGTTSTRAILFDEEGRARRTAQRALRQHHPRPGWVEHDPEEIWRSVLDTCREAAAAADGRVAAIGIADQRETTLLWERETGRPVGNAIVWQDRRTAELCRHWQEEGLAPLVEARTGLVIDPYFSASKVAWLLDATPGLERRARDGEILFGTIDSFLIWRLTGGRAHATDVTNACRTMLFDIERLEWDEELLAAFGIPRALLPEPRDNDARFGQATRELLGGAVPITGVAGDQQAALVGQACFAPGMVKSTYGTGAFALLNTGGMRARSRHRLLSTIGYRLGGATAYALEGSIFVAGAAVGWLRDRLGIFENAAQSETLARAADPRQRVHLVPGFAGLGAPYWAPAARGAILGLTAECGAAEIARASLEAVGHQTADLVAAMAADAGVAVSTLRVDGGMAVNDWAMQFVADIVPASVERPAYIETTAWGAAYLAGLAVGIYPAPAEMAAKWSPAARFTPQMSEEERAERRAGWGRAVAAVLAAAGP